MRLVRNATIYVGGDENDWKSWSMQFGDVTIRTIPIGSAPQAPKGHHRLLVQVKSTLIEVPQLDDRGMVVTPDGPRKRCEAGIELTADVIGTYLATRRSISSPVPWIANIPESDSDREFLQKARGIDFFLKARQDVREKIDLTKVPVDTLADRTQGLRLFSDALVQDDPLSAYRDLVRFFENAFALPTSLLGKKLTQFLNTGVARYARREVDGWLSLRDAAIHGDGKMAKYLVLQADVRPIVGRMIQAARDTLFNKGECNNPARVRRDVWRPIACVADSEGAIEIQQFCTPTLNAQLLDSFEAYPIDFTATINSPPPDWWCPIGELQSRQSGISIVEPHKFGSHLPPR